MKYLRWLLKAAIFFTLFAFALNNQQLVAVHFFFGTSWHAPLVMVVLAVFACGLALGVLVMVPRWWRKSAAGSAVRQPAQAKGFPASGVMQPDHSTVPISDDALRIARHGL